MKTWKDITFKPLFLLLCLLLLNFSVMADAVRESKAANTEQSHVKKGELLESKGIIEPAIELVNGRNFQQNFSFFKKNSSSHTHIGVKASLSDHFYLVSGDCFQHIPSIPLYIFNRSILI